MSGDIMIVGGAGGVEADAEDMDATGSRIRSTGWELGEIAVGAHRYLVDGELLASAPFSPVTFARFEGSMLAALDGGGAATGVLGTRPGLSAAAAEMVAAGTFMQAAARAYLHTDRALERLADARQYAQGRILGSLAPGAVPGLAGLFAALHLTGTEDDALAWLLEHPDLVEELAASSGGALDVYLPGVGFPSDAAEGAALLSLLYDQELGSLESRTERAAAASTLSDRFDRLRLVAEGSGQFAVEHDGDAAVVYLPGTEEFDLWFDPGGPLPDGVEENGLVRNLGTNFAAVGGRDNAYVEAVLRALRELPRGTDVSLVGHSQGGIVAARVAQAVAASRDPHVRVRSVVTAGSPVDHIELPDEVQMLSLVNEHDVVPRLDGEPADDRSNHTTVVVDRQLGSITRNHSVAEVYGPLAEALDRSGHPNLSALLPTPLRAGGSRAAQLTTWTMGRRP